MAVLNGGRLELGLRAGYIAPDYSRARAEMRAGPLSLTGWPRRYIFRR